MIDPAGDFAFVTDNVEYVTHRSLGVGGTFADTSGVVALRRALSRTEIGLLGGARFAQNRLVWNLEAAALSLVKPGDRIRDAVGVEWVVELCDLQTWSARWRCTCLRAK